MGDAAISSMSNILHKSEVLRSETHRFEINTLFTHINLKGHVFKGRCQAKEPDLGGNGEPL